MLLATLEQPQPRQLGAYRTNGGDARTRGAHRRGASDERLPRGWRPPAPAGPVIPEGDSLRWLGIGLVALGLAARPWRRRR